MAANYIDKQMFRRDVEKALQAELPSATMGLIFHKLDAVLERYELQRVSTELDKFAVSNDYIDMFIAAKYAEYRSENTLKRYRYVLNQFFNTEQVSTLETTAHHIRDYFSREHERGVSDSTINGIRDVLNAYFGWLSNEGLLMKNPCANVGTLQMEEKERKSFTNLDIQKMLNVCENPRDSAIILFLLNTGCRVSEMTGLLAKNISTTEREGRVLGKGRKNRKIYFDDVTAWAIDVYLKRSPAAPNDPLFRSKAGKAMTANGVRQMLKRIEAKTDVEDVHPHRFRRTFATNAVNKNMPLQEVKALLGHKKLDTTMKYVYQNDERTRRAYEYYIG